MGMRGMGQSGGDERCSGQSRCCYDSDVVYQDEWECDSV